MAALWLSLFPFLWFSVSTCRVGHCCTELNINSSVWWGKLQRFGHLLSDPLLGKQHQVMLDIGCALPTAGPDSPAWPWSCRRTCISGLCFMILSHLGNWPQSFYFLALWLLHHWLVQPSFCFTLASPNLLLCPMDHNSPRSYHHGFCSYSRVSGIHLVPTVPFDLLAVSEGMFSFPGKRNLDWRLVDSKTVKRGGKSLNRKTGDKLERVMLWFMIRNMYLVLVPVSGSELLKSLEFPKRKRAKNVILYVNEVILDHN